MSNLPITALPTDSVVEALDVLVNVDASTGTTRKFTVGDLTAYLQTQLASGGVTTGNVPPTTAGAIGDLYIDESTTADTIYIFTSEGWQPLGGTNLSIGEISLEYIRVLSSTGDSVIIPSAETNKAGLMSASDKTNLEALLAKDCCPDLFTPTSPTDTDGGNYTPGDEIVDSSGDTYRLLTVDGVDTWVQITQEGTLLIDPTSVTITAGIECGAEFCDNGQNFIYNGTDFNPYPGVAADDGATGVVTPGTVGSAPTTSTVGTEGELTTDGSTCYILRELAVAASLPAGPLSIFATTGGGPFGITKDSAGNIYTTNVASNNVSKITPAGVSTILGTTGAQPRAITTDSAGNIYTANVTANNVSKITPAGVSTILGTTGGSPYGIVTDSAGNVYTANQGSSNVSKITPAGVSTILGTTGAQPRGITIDSTGNIYTANLASNNVSKITPAGVSTILGTTGGSPRGIVIDSAENIYTANYTSNNVSKITPAGVSTILGTTGTNPYGITIDSAENIYTANYTSNNVSKITPAGVSTILGTTGTTPVGIVIDSAGNIYTSNFTSNNVSKSTNDGSASSTYTWDTITCPSTDAWILSEGDFTIDGSGVPIETGDVAGRTAIDDTDPNAIIVWRWDGTEWVDVTALNDTVYTAGSGGGSASGSASVEYIAKTNAGNFLTTNGVYVDAMSSDNQVILETSDQVGGAGDELLDYNFNIGVGGVLYYQALSTRVSNVRVLVNDIEVLNEAPIASSWNAYVFNFESGDNIKIYATIPLTITNPPRGSAGRVSGMLRGYIESI